MATTRKSALAACRCAAGMSTCTDRAACKPHSKPPVQRSIVQADLHKLASCMPARLMCQIGAHTPLLCHQQWTQRAHLSAGVRGAARGTRSRAGTSKARFGAASAAAPQPASTPGPPSSMDVDSAPSEAAGAGVVRRTTPCQLPVTSQVMLLPTMLAVLTAELCCGVALCPTAMHCQPARGTFGHSGCSPAASRAGHCTSEPGHATAAPLVW